MRFGIRFPDGDVMSFSREGDARLIMLQFQRWIEAGDEAARFLYSGGVLVAKAENEDEWLEVEGG